MFSTNRIASSCSIFLAGAALVACSSNSSGGNPDPGNGDSGVDGSSSEVSLPDGAGNLGDTGSSVRDAGATPDLGTASSDAGPTHCDGAPTVCASLSASSCTLTQGCSLTSVCGGISTSCYSLFDSYSCSSQQGCFWDSGGSSCSGSAWQCNIVSEAGCFMQQGCSVSNTCGGSATPCALIPVSECSSQPGCTAK